MSPARDFDVRVAWDDQARVALRTALKGHADTDSLAALIAKAGAEEALAMATGEYVPEGLPGVRLYRVFCLIRAGMLLSDAEQLVACIFKIKPTEAKGLVNKAFARYAVPLEQQIAQAISQLLEEARWNGEDRWEVRIPWDFAKERITNELSDLELPHPTRTDRGSLWAFPEETYQGLRQLYSLPDRQRGPGRVA